MSVPLAKNSASTPYREGIFLWQLEAVRGAAACYIAVGHLCRIQLGELIPGLNFFLGFGQEAVIAFFLLSGFVIHWSVAHKPGQGFATYLGARALRIYPLFVLTLLTAMVVAWIQQSTDPRNSWGTLLGNLLMLQDWGAVKPGVWVEVYAGILVLWSLSYEWWFYMLYFPLSRRIPIKIQAWAVSVLTVSQALVYVWQPNQASRFLMYFSIWWTGVELARLKFAGQPFTLRSLAVPLGTVAAITVILGYDVWHEYSIGTALRSGTHPCLELRHFLAALVITGVALLWRKIHWIGFKPLLGTFTRAAPWSYALYLLHEPLALDAHPFQAVANPLVKATLNLGLVVLAAWWAETYFQKWCRRVFEK